MTKLLVLVLAVLVSALAACAAPETVEVVREVVVTATSIPATRVPTRIPPTATSERVEPSLTDFDLELIIIEDQCFNTAGALVTVRPDLYYDGPDLPPSARYLLVYKVIGGENVETFNLEIEGDSYSFDDETISTSSCNYDLSIELVRLLEN